MNRRGEAGDWLNFGGFFLIVIVIAGGIVGGYLVFFGQGYNFKEAETSSLLSAVEGCLSENNFLEEDFDFFSVCRLNENVLEEEHLVLVRNVDSGEEIISVGVRDYVTQCELIDENDKFAECLSGEIESGGENFEIIVGTNQGSRVGVA